MIPSNTQSPVQAFPIKIGTKVFTSGVTAFEVDDDLIIHMNVDGQITCRYNSDATPGSITVDAAGGSDWAISRDFDSIDVSVSCIISHA